VGVLMTAYAAPTRRAFLRRGYPKLGGRRLWSAPSLLVMCAVRDRDLSELFAAPTLAQALSDYPIPLGAFRLLQM
jgi:hypothetical protein